MSLAVRVRSARRKGLRHVREYVSIEVTAALVGAMTAGVVSLVGAVVVQRLNQKDRRREIQRAEAERMQTRREEFLFRSREHFGGGTQERSVGIAIAEAFWKRVPDQVDVLVPLLLNQVVYLLAVVGTTKSADAAHERQNVRRILALLDEIGAVERFRDSYESSMRAIDQPHMGRGLDLSADPDIKQAVSAYLAKVRSQLRV